MQRHEVDARGPAFGVLVAVRPLARVYRAVRAERMWSLSNAGLQPQKRDQLAERRRLEPQRRGPRAGARVCDVLLRAAERGASGAARAPLTTGGLGMQACGTASSLEASRRPLAR